MSTKKAKKIDKKLRTAIQRRKERHFLSRLTGNHLEISRAECAAVMEILGDSRTLESAIKLVSDATERGEYLVAEILEEDPPREPIACKQGCAFCCHFPLDVTPPEIICMAEFLRKKLPGEELAAVRRRAAELAKKTWGMSTTERTGSGVPCALLVDNLCSVYPVRPLLCRGWNSLEIQACQSAYETGDIESAIPRYLPQSQIMFLVQLGMMAGLHASGFRPMLLESTAALRIALENRGAAEQWLEHKPVFSPAQSKQKFQYTSRFWEKFYPQQGD